MARKKYQPRYIWDFRCVECGKPFRSSRIDAKTHNAACRLKRFRRLRAEAEARRKNGVSAPLPKKKGKLNGKGQGKRTAG